MAGRPKGSKNKATETVGNVTLAAKQLPTVVQKIEVQRSPLHVSASVGACFKTGRVGITSLSIQAEYDGEVSEGVDNIADLCLKEWDRLAQAGLTQQVPDTYYGDIQKPEKRTGSKSVSGESETFTTKPETTEVDDLVADFDAQNLEEVNVQDVDTVADGEAALDEIQKTAEINEEKTFDADAPIDIPSVDDFDVMAAEFESEFKMEVKEVAEEVNITEDIVEPKVNVDGDVEFDDKNVDPAKTLGFEGAETDEFQVDMKDIDLDEKLEENEPSMLCVFDLTPDQQRVELDKRGVTELNGVPLAEAPEPDLIITLDDLLTKEQG